MSDNLEKFLSQPKEKQERIINAAMAEFTMGYKKASTDNIVRKAGISKGLLFHYFGTKENLYNFLVDYAIDTIKRENFDLVNAMQPDILESIWQLSLLKQDLSIRFPTIFDFTTSIYTDTSSEQISDKLQKFYALQASMIQDIYARADTSLFRDDINPKLAMDVITWTLQGYGQSKRNIAPSESLGAASREAYGQMLDELQEILNMLRKCFYN